MRVFGSRQIKTSRRVCKTESVGLVSWVLPWGQIEESRCFA